ncbi:response regulator [Aerococcus urinae]|uniref:response regulator n=1 Tax=Aerococcus urinae TaxID=1376 RepID=UPI00254D2678|nr:response regulator [Aerococcus urinae]MDK8485574.1 response regulator [Aerococcus urinae]
MYKVMLVEDDRMVQAINQQYVEKVDGFQVTGITETYEAALDLLEKEHFDLLLIDDYLGESQCPGLQLVEYLVTCPDHPGVIMLTAQNAKSAIQKGLNLGVQNYILKPFTFERLESSLLRFKKERELLNQEEEIDQDTLDQLYGYPDDLGSDNRLADSSTMEMSDSIEKGLTFSTMEVIAAAIESQDCESFTIPQITQKSQLSHVTVRKYIHYLVKKGYLKTFQYYGTTGRPTIHYQQVHPLDRSL